MKILFLTPSFSPRFGGVEKSVMQVSDELMRMENEIIIITEKSSPLIPHFEKINGINIYRIPKSPIPKTGMILRWLWFIKHIGLIIKSDVIHFHDFHVFIYWFLPFRFLFFFKRYYITFHGYEGFPLRKKIILMRKFCEKFSNGSIAVGNYISKWYKANPDYTYYGAVKKNQNELVINQSDNILFIGRLEYDTCFIKYIEALKIFKAEYKKEFVLHICGDGQLKTKGLAMLKEAQIKYKFYGFVKNIESIICQSRIVLASSYLAIIESLSLGKPVIGFYDNPLKEDYLKCFPEQKNLFFVIGNVLEAAAILNTNFEDYKSHEDMIRYAFNYSNKLVWKDVAKLYISLYGK